MQPREWEHSGNHISNVYATMKGEIPGTTARWRNPNAGKVKDSTLHKELYARCNPLP